MIIGVCLFRMNATRLNPVIHNLLFRFVMLAVCLALYAC